MTPAPVRSDHPLDAADRAGILAALDPGSDENEIAERRRRVRVPQP
jgi:hypothetical protein